MVNGPLQKLQVQLEQLDEDKTTLERIKVILERMKIDIDAGKWGEVIDDLGEIYKIAGVNI
jgi:hypothetical protein